MGKKYLIFILFLVILSSLPLVTSNFVCGIVNDSKGVSSSWRNILIYSEEHPDQSIICRSNPENKFCCDLENVSIGDNVFAEVFDEESGFVSNKVNLVITGEGYDLFPQMNMEKAILINSPNNRIFINQSQLSMNLSLAENYDSLNYSFNSLNHSFEEHFCDNCGSFLLPLNLDKGKNEIILTAYGDREISEKIDIYNLDYLILDINVICNKCKKTEDYFYVPSGDNITFSSSFNSSHNISGEFLFYFPSEWALYNSSIKEDFSATHNAIKETIDNKKESTKNYSFVSPNVFIKTDYLFYQKLDNQESTTRVRVFKLKIIPFHKKKPFEQGYFNQALAQRASPDEPVILYSKEDYLQTIAIFPNIEIDKAYSNLKFETKKSGGKIEHIFTILTSIQNKDIESIFLVFKVENGKNIHVYEGSRELSLELYKNSQDYTYYSTWAYDKGPFIVIFS